MHMQKKNNRRNSVETVNIIIWHENWGGDCIVTIQLHIWTQQQQTTPCNQW